MEMEDVAIVSDVPVEASRMDSKALARYVSGRMVGILVNLADLRPFVTELWNRFDLLKGNQTIAGCRTRKEYCEKVLHRTDRAVRYMLAGGNPVSKRVRNSNAGPRTDSAPTSVLAIGAETVSAPGSKPAGGRAAVVVADCIAKTIVKAEVCSSSYWNFLRDDLVRLAAEYLRTRGIKPDPRNGRKSRATPSTKVPTFGYPGSKARLAKRIAAMLPSGKRFVEPFAGRGNVYFYVAAHGMYPSYWLNDDKTAPFLFTMRIGHILSVPESGHESLVKYRARFRDKNGSPLSRNHALLVEPYLCWNGGVYGQSGGTRGGTRAGFQEKIRVASEILRGTETEITRLDYREVLAQCGPGDVLYIDPPYMHGNVKAYDTKTIDYPGLVKTLTDAKFKWVLSEYEEPIYVDAFGEPAIRIPVKRGKGKPGGGSKGTKDAVECFWTNFDLPQIHREPERTEIRISALADDEAQRENPAA